MMKNTNPEQHYSNFWQEMPIATVKHKCLFSKEIDVRSRVSCGRLTSTHVLMKFKERDDTKP